MTRLSRSVERAADMLAGADLAADSAVRELLELTWQRRHLDLSDLSPVDQATLISERSQELHPSADALACRIREAAATSRSVIAKLGIDPTGHEVHLGHAVPMILLSRLQRMGHQVVFIVGDVTAKIGDPSGRSEERPALTDDDIAHNLATYREQVAPFFDFSRAQFRYNGDWLREVTLPRLIEITTRIPVSMSLQREDFRARLDGGQGLSLAEMMYSVIMALDSVEVRADLELGGVDQLLNMQMCRKVMGICGQDPEIVVATSLIEGTDGTGAKMSKSKNNYVPLAAPAGEMFGKIMSIPDRLVDQYLRALTEWRDPEIATARRRLADGSLHPVDLKKILAGEVTASVLGVDAAMKARGEFTAHFSSRAFAAAGELPAVTDLSATFIDVVRTLGFARSSADARRIARQNGLRVVIESETGQHQIPLTADEAREPIRVWLATRLNGRPGALYLKVGRKLARIEGWPAAGHGQDHQ